MKRFVVGSRYYFTRLSDYEKEIYNQIYDCWAKGESVAKIGIPGSDFTLPSGIELHQLVTYIVDDNPDLFHIETSQFRYSRVSSQVTIAADKVYTPEEYRQVYEKLISRAEQLIENARQYPSGYERVRYLHDYLAENILYDNGGPEPRAQRETHTIVGALLNSAAVCEGYARAYQLLCDQLGISCIVAVGEGTSPEHRGPHAWNIVRVDNRAYHVDVTWDSCLIAKGAPVADDYFLRSDAVFLQDHLWDSNLYAPIHEDYRRGETRDPIT